MAIKPGYVHAFSTCFSLSIEGCVSTSLPILVIGNIYHLLSYTAIWIIISTYQCPFNAIFCGFPNFPTRRLLTYGWMKFQRSVEGIQQGIAPKRASEEQGLGTWVKEL